MIYDISHRTYYRYSAQVMQSQHLVHMSPREVSGQAIRHHSLIIEPAPLMRSDDLDAFGNPVAMLDIEMPHSEFVLHARTTIDLRASQKDGAANSAPWDALDDVLKQVDSAERLEIAQFRCPTRLTEPTLDIKDFAAASFPPGRATFDGALALSHRIYREFTFDRSATDVSTPISDVFRHRRGVCQDFAHLMLAGLRALHIPARYVSGYILTKPPLGHPRLQGADASHAWVSVWTGPWGWVGLDPTNGLLAEDEHITFAWGRDYDDVCPISGVLIGGGEHDVSVSVDVVPVA